MQTGCEKFYSELKFNCKDVMFLIAQKLLYW